MNNCIFIGRFTADPKVTEGEGNAKRANFTLAIDKDYKRDGEPTADFLNFVAFGSRAEFIEKYFSKGMKIAVIGRANGSSYKDNEGKTKYNLNFIVDRCEFCEPKNSQTRKTPEPEPQPDGEFMDIPADASDEGLPFV